MGNGRSIGVGVCWELAWGLASGLRPNAQITLVHWNYITRFKLFGSRNKWKNATFFLNLSLFMEHFLAFFSSLFLPKGGILQHWLWEVLGPAVPCTPTSGCGKLVLVLWNAIAAKTWDGYMFRSPENSLSVLKLTPLRTREPLLHPQDGYRQTNDNSRAILLQKRKCGEQLDEDRGYLKLWALSESYWFDYDSTMTSNFT